MNGTAMAIWMIWGSCLIVVARCAAGGRHPIISIVCGAASGLGGVAFVNLLAPMTGTGIPVTKFTTAVVAVLGIPGVILLLLMNVLLL